MKQLFCGHLLLFSFAFFAYQPAVAQKRQVGKNKASINAKNDFIKNGIQLKSKGFKVSEAYLFLDDESIVPEGNKVELNQQVNLLLIIDSGWTEKEGRVFPGSTQTIKLNNGTVISTSEELFEAFNDLGVPTEEATYITLNSSITGIKDKRNYAIINFRVWDKKGLAEITDSYKLFIK